MIFNKKKEAQDLLKTALLVKCLHIPSYIIFFVFGVMAGLMFFMTFPLIMFIIFIDIIFPMFKFSKIIMNMSPYLYMKI